MERKRTQDEKGRRQAKERRRALGVRGIMIRGRPIVGVARHRSWILDCAFGSRVRGRAVKVTAILRNASFAVILPLGSVESRSSPRLHWRLRAAAPTATTVIARAIISAYFRRFVNGADRCAIAPKERGIFGPLD